MANFVSATERKGSFDKVHEDGIDYAEYLESLEPIDDASDTDTELEVVQYPWPCPKDWPLVPEDSVEDPQPQESTPAKRPTIERSFHLRTRDSYDVSPTKAVFDRQDNSGAQIRPTLRHPRQGSTVKFSEKEVDTRIKVVALPSPVKGPDFTDPFTEESVEDSIEELPHAFKNTARSVTSTTSSRRRDRISFIETFNRKQSGLPAARRLQFPAEFVSRRITEPTLKPWKDEKDPRIILIRWIPLLGMVIGLGLGALLIYMGYKGVPKHNFCQILNEDWSQGINPNVWTREVNLGGFGTGEFEWATDSDNNSFVENGRLHIRPTLTEDALGAQAVLNGYTVDLTADGSCTGTTASDCIATSNSTTNTILPPVQSARLISKGKFSMKYGKIEVVARMPRGDWLWPAIWMLPEDSVYGAWPMSGEIDIAESRGNGISYAAGGRNMVSTTLHWGPSSVLDAFFRTNNPNTEFHSDYTHQYFTFGLEWTDKYLYTYINSHLRQVFYIKFDEPFFTRGEWPAIDTTNKTAIANPWAGAHNNAAPFDQEFYLILNVAVGTSFGFFPDGVGNKPWVDGTATASADFYSAKDTWYPTWGQDDHRDMVVDSVKAWKLC